MKKPNRIIRYADLAKWQTIVTYNNKSIELAKKYDKSKARTKHIKETLAIVGKKNPRVIEIGCGSGRDAAEIAKRTNDYLGIDVSEKMIELARHKVPGAKFHAADALNFSFPRGVDVFFAFASLVHAPKNELKTIFRRCRLALNDNGIFRLSVKYSPRYNMATVVDEFGARTYYLYSKKDIAEAARDFKILKNEIEIIRGQKWLEITLRKTT